MALTHSLTTPLPNIIKPLHPLISMECKIRIQSIYHAVLWKTSALRPLHTLLTTSTLVAVPPNDVHKNIAHVNPGFYAVRLPFLYFDEKTLFVKM